MKKLLGFILLVLLTNAWAEEVIVHDKKRNLVGTYFTIQDGINACPEGGRVSVSPGTYNEAIYISKNISLIAIGSPTITAEGLGEANTITFDEATSTISGFIITQASREDSFFWR